MCVCVCVCVCVLVNNRSKSDNMEKIDKCNSRSKRI